MDTATTDSAVENVQLPTLDKLTVALQNRAAHFKAKQQEVRKQFQADYNNTAIGNVVAETVQTIQDVVAVEEEQNRTPKWLAKGLSSFPKLIESLPRIRQTARLFGVDIPEISIAKETVQNGCDALQSAITILIQWLSSPIIFVWFVFSLLMHLSLVPSISVPILHFVHGLIFVITATHHALKRWKSRIANFLGWFRATIYDHGVLQRVQERVAEYKSMQEFLQLRLIDKVVIHPLSAKCEVSDIVPYLVYLSSLNLLLVKSNILYNNNVEYGILWLLQLFSIMILDFIPQAAICYAGAVQIMAQLMFVFNLSIHWFVIAAAMFIAWKLRNHADITDPKQFQITALSYANFTIPYCILGYIATSIWKLSYWNDVGAIITIHFISGLVWMLICALSTKIRFPIFGVCQNELSKVKFAVLFALIPFTFQHALVGWIHAMVAFWTVPDIVISSGKQLKLAHLSTTTNEPNIEKID